LPFLSDFPFLADFCVLFWHSQFITAHPEPTNAAGVFILEICQKEKAAETFIFPLLVSQFRLNCAHLKQFATRQRPHMHFFYTRLHSAAWQRFMQAFHKADNMTYD